MRRHTPSGDRRAVTPVVTHVLTVTITSLLVIGLLAASASYLNMEEKSNARQELDAIGNRLADEVSRVDALAENGGRASILTRHPDRITGGGYSVSQRPAVACDGIGDSCLVLESHDIDAIVRVPLSYNNSVIVQTTGSGTFNITALDAAPSPPVGDRGTAGLDVRVGVGSDIQEDPLGTRLTARNEVPVPRFTVEPQPPTTGFTHFINGSRSLDFDGNVTEHKWDVGNDGNYTMVGSVVPHWFVDPGRQAVTLRVADDANERAASTLTRNVTLSGLEYNGDIEERGSTDSIRFSLYNNLSSEIRLDSILLDDLDDNVDEIGNCEDDTDFGDFDAEVNIDVDSDGDRDSYIQYDDEHRGSCLAGVEIPDDGLIFDVDQLVLGADTSAPGRVPTVDPGENVTIDLSGLDDPTLEGTRWRLGVAYVHQGVAAETVIRDTVGAPHVTDFEVTNAGDGNVSIRVEADRELDSLSVRWGGPGTGPNTLHWADFDEISTDPWVYEAGPTDVSMGASGLYWAELGDARDNGVSAFDTSHSDTTVAANNTADPVWRGVSDWNQIGPQRGVVHDAFGDHVDDRVGLGYTPSDQGGSNLTAYWPMDDGGVMSDESTNSNDGNTTAVFDETVGLFGTTSYSFYSDSSRVDGIASTNELSGGDNATITVSTWIHPRGVLGTSDEAAVVAKLNGTTGGDWGIVVNASCPSYAQGGCDGTPAIGYYGGNATDEYALLHGPVTQGDTWHHVAFVLDGENDNLDLYFDGDPVESDGDIPAFASANTSRDVIVGEHPATGANFDGYIDETRVYDRALSGGEIQALYDASTRGDFVTAQENATTDLDVSSLNLSAAVDIPYGGVTVTVVTDQGERSDPIALEDGDGTYEVTGLTTDTDGYRLEVAIESTSRNASPAIDALVVHEVP